MTIGKEREIIGGIAVPFTFRELILSQEILVRQGSPRGEEVCLRILNDNLVAKRCEDNSGSYRTRLMEDVLDRDGINRGRFYFPGSSFLVRERLSWRKTKSSK